MVFNIFAFFCLLAQLSFVFADISILTPTAGSTFAATSSITVTWEDDGEKPSLSSDILTISILLCTGPNSNIQCFYTGVNAQTPTTLGGTYTFPLTAARALAANGQFYLQFYATTANSGYSIHYSPRFTLTGMTGTLQATAGSDVSPPAAQVVFNNNAQSTANIFSLNTVEYTLQTGYVRYAPMQLQPPTKVTQKLSASRRYPTSAVSLRATWTEKPIQTSTVTPSPTYSIEQEVNWATWADEPTVVGYYAASEALSRTINAKSRRGYYDL